MPPKIPRSRYTGKPVRRLRLPKIGPPKTKGFFEEYLYVLLGMVFVSTTILGKAGGMSPFNALVVGAWITAALWFASQWKGYLAEKEKAANGKALAASEAERAEASKGPLPLPLGMKPMIGPQWPVKAGARPSWPKLPKEQTVLTKSQVIQPTAATSNETSQPNSEEKKRVFVYERPTLPDRPPKLPRNWADLNDKKEKDKKRDHKKPKR